MKSIWFKMPARRQQCKGTCIKSHNHAITIISQSAQKEPAPGNPYNESIITVYKFIHLGTTLSIAVHTDDEVTARIKKACVAYKKLRANALERNGIKLDTKLKVYKAVALPTL